MNRGRERERYGTGYGHLAKSAFNNNSFIFTHEYNPFLHKIIHFRGEKFIQYIHTNFILKAYQEVNTIFYKMTTSNDYDYYEGNYYF